MAWEAGVSKEPWRKGLKRGPEWRCLSGNGGSVEGSSGY